MFVRKVVAVVVLCFVSIALADLPYREGEVLVRFNYLSGNIIYVDREADDGGDGLSWDTAFNNLQEAIDFAGNYGDFIEVWVAADTYRPEVEGDGVGDYQDATFDIPAGDITIRGHFGGIGYYETDPSQRDFNNPDFETILSGDFGVGYKSNYVVSCNDIGVGLVLENLSFTGSADTGLKIDNYSDPFIVRCKFYQNVSNGIIANNYGRFDIVDSVFFDNGTADINLDISSRPYIKNCTFDGQNSTKYALHCEYSEMLMEESIIKNHTSYGIYLKYSNISLVDCNIEDNSSYGIYCTNYSTLDATACAIQNNNSNGVKGLNSTVKLKDCDIHNNNSSGMYYSNSTVEISESAIHDNLNHGIICAGGNVKISGCAIFNHNNDGVNTQNCNIEVAGCTIYNNKDRGIRTQSALLTLITNNIIYSNKDYGIFIDSCGSILIRNNLIYKNGTSGADCGLYFARCFSPPEAYGNTVVDNYPFGIYVNEGFDPCLVNNIVWDNGAVHYYNIFSERGLEGITASYNCVEGGFTGTGNISCEPNFRDADANDYHLTEGSSCISAADPDADYTGQTDIDGRPRVLYGLPDIGSDEWANPSDYNFDGFVDFEDFAYFAHAWLQEDSFISLNNNNVVDIEDLYMFAECWLWTTQRSEADYNRDGIVNFYDFSELALRWPDINIAELVQFCHDWLWTVEWD